jgi:hypothetical protein
MNQPAMAQVYPDCPECALALAQSLKAVGVSITSWHRYFDRCPKGTVTYYCFLEGLFPKSGRMKGLGIK